MLGIGYGDFVDYKGRVYLCVYAGVYEGRPILRLRFLTRKMQGKEFWASCPWVAEKTLPPTKKALRAARRL